MLYCQRTLDKLYAATGCFSRLLGQFSDRFGAKLLQIIRSSLCEWIGIHSTDMQRKRSYSIENIIDEYKVTIKNIVTLRRRAVF